MRKLMARVVLRSALAISAVGIVAAAGVFDATPNGPNKSSPKFSTQVAVGDPAGRPVTEPGAPAASSYTLRTENGPRAAMAARVVTATLLLTGLILTALGAIGMRGPVLFRRSTVVDDILDMGYTPAFLRGPGGHPRFGPPPT
ncbi:MAG TPA: hypothetical protein VLH10_03120 [Yinghuangia sp.]|uniref:hypothetical protein n=1 Tax=Yinghuangia sp. YIM S10712 TaxID=3436930 RepID=UPI002B6E2CF5|nr:hypothetical protein [Yinghuangia sp.]